MDICRVKKREKVAYGMGDLGNNIAYGAVGFYFVFFLTDFFFLVIKVTKFSKVAAD